MKKTYTSDPYVLTQSPSKKEYAKAGTYVEKSPSKSSSSKISKQSGSISIRYSGEDKVTVKYNVDRERDLQIRRLIKDLLKK